MKFTLIGMAVAAENPAVFNQVLKNFFDGEPDPATLRLLTEEHRG